VVEMTQKASEVQKFWSKSTFDDRRRVLQTILNYVTSHKEEICHIVARDSGKPSTLPVILAHLLVVRAGLFVG